MSAVPALGLDPDDLVDPMGIPAQDGQTAFGNRVVARLRRC